MTKSLVQRVLLKSLRGAIFASIMVGVALLALQAIGGQADAKEEYNAMDEKQMVEEGLKVATFAGGCFWCLQPPYDQLDGVLDTIVGYTGGHIEDPTYSQVTSGTSGHVEAIRVLYDPKKISFEKLVDTFWRNIDPTQADGQFADRGPQYETVVFFHDDEQKIEAERSKEALGKSGKFEKPIVTRIEAAGEFYKAERSHQDYYKKNAVHYNLYKVGSGRAGFIKSTWGAEDNS